MTTVDPLKNRRPTTVYMINSEIVTQQMTTDGSLAFMINSYEIGTKQVTRYLSKMMTIFPIDNHQVF